MVLTVVSEVIPSYGFFNRNYVIISNIYWRPIISYRPLYLGDSFFIYTFLFTYKYWIYFFRLLRISVVYIILETKICSHYKDEKYVEYNYIHIIYLLYVVSGMFV